MVSEGDEREGRVNDGSLEERQVAVARCWWRIAEVKNVLQAVEGVLAQGCGDVNPNVGKVLVVGIGGEGEPVEEQ